MAVYYKDKNGNLKKKKGKVYVSDENGKATNINEDEDDIAPVREEKVEYKPVADWLPFSKQANEYNKRYAEKQAKAEKEGKTVGGNKDSWFKSGAFSDGYQFGDVIKTGVSTKNDLMLGVTKGVLGLAEGITDLGGYAAAGIADLVGADDVAKRARKRTQKSWVDGFTKNYESMNDTDSILGNKADAVSQGLGQVGTIILTGGAAGAAGLGSAGVTALTTGVTGVSSVGSGMSEAYNAGATDGEAVKFGLTTGLIDAGTELLFGGLGKGVKALGVSRGIGGLDDIFAKKLSSKVAKAFTNPKVQKAVGNTVEYAVKSGAEGSEEVISSILKKLAFQDDETLGKLVEDEDLLEQFVVGALVSGIAQGGDFAKSQIQGTDFVTGHTQNEEYVIDKIVEKEVAQKEANGEKVTKKDKTKIYDDVVERVEKGYIDIDTIEEVLGGENYDAYKKATDKNAALKAERDRLNDIKGGDLTGRQSDRLAQLKAMNLDDTSQTDGLKKKMSEDVFNLLASERKGEGSILLESYRERNRRGQAFFADLTKYEGKKREAVERAIKSGVLNNTNRSHELVDILSNIEADKGIVFDYTNNDKLKESGFAVDGKTINGFVKDGAVTLNMQSSKAWESTVGHEITHVLEGTEAYSALQTSLFEYAKSKGEFDTRKAEIAKLYENVKNADIDGELTAELISDYLFNDKSFINHLTGNRTVFQKVWDEVKYLYKVATGKEKASIEKVMKEFDRAWKEMGKVEQSGVKYSVSKDIENSDNSWYNEVKLPYAEQERVQSEALTWNADKRNQLLTQTLSNGITYRYMVDDDGIVHIYGREMVDDSHERKKEYDNTNRKRLDYAVEELRIRQGNNSERVNIGENGRKQGQDDTNDNLLVSGEGRSYGTGYSKNRTNANRKPKEWHFNEDGSTEITYSDGTKEIEDIAPTNKASSADGVFFDAKKHSLSDFGEQPSSVGTPLRDLALAPTQEDIAPVAENATATNGASWDAITPMTEEEANALQDEKVNAHSKTSLEAIQVQLENLKEERADSFARFEQKIANKQAKLNSKKNKETKVANKLRMQIENLKQRRDSVDADYAKSIATAETRERLVREGKPTTRQEHHNNIMNDIKATFSSSGYDFDDVLRKAKDLSTFSTVDNTPQRVMEKALGYKEGQILSDLTVNKVAQNETNGIKWLNSFTDRKNGLLAQISKQYGIKPGSKESAAAQMYAEGFYVADNDDIIAYGDAELAKDFPNVSVRNNIKGLAQDPRIRQIYDETLEAINESRRRNAYPEIQKLDNYFLHFRAMEDTFSRLGLPFNPNDIRAKDLPTDLNGVTADLKPGQPYFASAMHRQGKRTSFDLLGGLERYLSSAKNQIYHIDDIQTLRALRNYIADNCGQAHGLESIDVLTEEEAQEKIKEVYGAHLSTFAKFLNEEANVLAGKTTLIDRGLEGIIGRRGITFLDTVNKQVGSNMVGYSASSAIVNFDAIPRAIAKSNKFAFIKALAQTGFNKLRSIYGKGDGFAENSPVIIRRKGTDRFYRTPFQKASDFGYTLMGAVDDISTEIIARTKFNELTKKGMSEQQAHFETDKWVSRLMGDRSLGQMPQLYNSKTLGLFTKFQLEVRNNLDSQFYDTIQEAKVSNEDIKNGLARNAKTAAKITSTFVQLAVAQCLFGKAFELIAGYNPSFDIISTLVTMFGFDDDEESKDTMLDNVEQGFLELLEDLPYTSTFTGGRIPIASALPVKQFITGKDQYGNEKSRKETLLEVAPYYVLPGGYGQIKKTAQGLGMFSDEHPVKGSYTDSGNLRFPVADTLGNRIQAGLFGQYASGNAREYFDNGYAPLKEKQIQEYQDVELPIGDYWKYREGLKGLKTHEEKANYIDSLDIEDWQKNLLMNNILDRKEDVDMSNYDDFADWEEFDFAQKNPEKYEFFRANGISYSDYANADDDGKDAYNWAYNNPEKLALSKAVADDVITYRSYTGDLYDIKADKDEYGKSINGSRKAKVIDYINNLDADYETKIILYKLEYPADDTYNYEIIEYLNNRQDLTYEERVAIFTELGFTVKDGNVYW